MFWHQNKRLSMSSSASAAQQPAFELKGRMLTLSVLRLLDPQPERLGAELDAKIASAPEFFRSLPVILDLAALAEPPDLKVLAELLRQRGLAPVGVHGTLPGLEQAAATAGLGLFQRLDGAEPRRVEPRREPAEARAGMVVRQPVRSGQQVYARGGDLVVLGPVQPGAEVLADGHIHVYGPLRGRALAGVQGDAEARIFCQRLEAELVSIAGAYQISEYIDEQDRGRPVQVFLAGDELRIEAL